MGGEEEWRRFSGGCRNRGGKRNREGARSESSIRRSRSELRRRALAANIDHLLTLGKRGKFATRDEALATWAKFERTAHRLLGPYVSVVEEHASGGFHLHVGVHGFQRVRPLRRLWMRALGGTGQERGELTPGNIDVVDRRSRRPRSTAGYLSKYIGKGGAQVAACRKSYSCSRGLGPSSVRRWFVPVSMNGNGDRVHALLEDAYLRDFEARPWSMGGAAGMLYWAEDG